MSPATLLGSARAFLGALARRAPKRVLGGALLLSTAGLTYAMHRPAVEEATHEDKDVAEDRSSVLPWCADGLEAIPGGACYAAPERAQGRVPLVLYLHGIFEKGAAEDEERERQRRLAGRAIRRGFAVLALRGVEGACTTTAERANKVCWPSNEWTADRAPVFVDSWQPALRAAAKRHPFDARYVLGFSNGGYFAGLVAERALYDADAFVVAHAGPVEPVKAQGNKPPLLLISADDDLSQEGMVRLDDELTRERWPHEHYVREGGGHMLADSDIDAALTFFERTRSESLPLRPSLSTRVPRARSARRDAGAEGGVAASAIPTTPSHPPSEVDRDGVAPIPEDASVPEPEPLRQPYAGEAPLTAPADR
jgi:dienelactone hydrolase